MRIYSDKRLVLLGSMIFIAAIGIGCKPFFDASPKVKSESTIPTVAKSGIDQTAQWLLQPGLFDIEQGVWLGSISLALGLVGTGFSIHCSRNSSRLNRKLNDKKNKISRLEDNIGNAYVAIEKLRTAVDENSTILAHLQLAYRQLDERNASLISSLNSQRLHQKPETQAQTFQLPKAMEPTPMATQTYIQSPAQKQAELTTAVNRGDANAVKAEIRAQLNITYDSENALSMGRFYETQLEEVTAGGSYWFTSFGGETWLYPTEQTLKGYSQSQRPTGVFTYIRQSIPSAQVISPARLAKNGALWSVIDQGVIAIPG